MAEDSVLLKCARRVMEEELSTDDSGITAAEVQLELEELVPVQFIVSGKMVTLCYIHTQVWLSTPFNLFPV